MLRFFIIFFFFFQAEDGIRDLTVTGVQTCALPILAVYLERADGGVVHVGEEALHDTPSEQARGGQCGMRSAECGIDARTSIPHSEFRIPHWLRRAEHSHRESDPPPSRESLWDSRRARESRQRVHGARTSPCRAGECSEGSAHQGRHAAALGQQRACRLEGAAVAHARRTDGLAPTAAKTAVA